MSPIPFVAALVLVIASGCGKLEPPFRTYEEAPRAPAAKEAGQHGGHLIDLAHGAYYAEVVIDEPTRGVTVYLLQEDFLKLNPIEQPELQLDLVERRPLPLKLTPKPLPNDPPGKSSRFVVEAALPESIRTPADLSGRIRVTIDGKPLEHPIHPHDHSHGDDHAQGHRHPPVAASLGRVLPQLIVYCLLIVAASFGGGWLPSLMTLTHTRMQLLISLVGGLMLGIGLLHLLPHAVAETGSVDSAARWALFGLLGMFFLIRTFHFHQHGVAEVPTEEFPSSLASQMGGPGAAGHACEHDHDQDHPHDHDHGYARDHDHDHDAGRRPPTAAASPSQAAPSSSPSPPGAAAAHAGSQGDPHGHHHHGYDHGHHHHHHHGGSSIGWVGVAVGLGLHTAIDGMVLAASMQSDAAHHPEGGLLGLGPFAAIVLHKPLDAVSITSLMRASGWSAGWRNAVNAGFALMCPLGAALFLLGMAQVSGSHSAVLGAALAFSAGVFLCISLGDLLPELEFHSHHRVRLSVALLVGIFAAWAIGLIEPAHLHGSAANGTHKH